ncbi:MAG: 2-dehydropantoate 2-reductase, partial [Clostridia bacterium]|nr:2-dehydropantoate 2-reductase [Clostridia bacterium]
MRMKPNGFINKMRVLIVGAGALGGYFGARLAESGLAVSLYAHTRAKALLIERQGLILTGQDGVSRVSRMPVYYRIGDVPPVDLALVLVKSYDTAAAASAIAKLYGKPRPLVLSLQNCLGNLEQLAAVLGGDCLLGGVTYEAAYEQAPGRILHTGSGNTCIAPFLPKQAEAAAKCAAIFNAAGLQALAATTAELDLLRWQKLIVNAAINPLTAIYRLRNGELAKSEQVRGEMMNLTREAVAVAQSLGISVDFAVVWRMVLDTCRKTAANRSSMLSDIERGRKTEIEEINGSIVALGRRAGLKMPGQERVLDLVRQLAAEGNPT